MTLTRYFYTFYDVDKHGIILLYYVKSLMSLLMMHVPIIPYNS